MRRDVSCGEYLVERNHVALRANCFRRLLGGERGG